MDDFDFDVNVSTLASCREALPTSARSLDALGNETYLYNAFLKFLEHRSSQNPCKYGARAVLGGCSRARATRSQTRWGAAGAPARDSSAGRAVPRPVSVVIQSRRKLFPRRNSSNFAQGILRDSNNCGL